MQQVILFGDSLTQRGYATGWVAQLSDAFQRAANVTNCGLSGYNTRWVLEHLTKENSPYVASFKCNGGGSKPPLFVALWLGANDAAMEGNYQAVPLGEYELNLRAIVEWIRDNLRPTHGILLITPPPCDGGAWAFKANQLYGTPVTAISRNVGLTRAYRDAALRVARDTECAGVVDMFSVFGADAPASEANAGSLEGAGPWQDCFEDGLHFNKKGDAIASAAIMDAVKHQLKVDIEKMPWAVPVHTLYLAPEDHGTVLLASRSSSFAGSTSKEETHRAPKSKVGCHM